MAHALLLSLFGPPSRSFLVPAKVATAAARSRGQERPTGRRAWRASLDGGEHGRTLPDYGTLSGLLRAVRPDLACLSLVLWLGLASAAPAYGAEATVEPVSISQIVDEAAARFELPPLWIHAVIAAESGGDAGAVSPKGAMGLMQLMPGTWRALSSQHQLGGDPFDRRANVLAGAAYLRQLFDQFGQDGFLAAYNAGPTRYVEARAGRRQLPAETVLYVARVERSIVGARAPTITTHTPTAAPWRASSLFVEPVSAGAVASTAELFARSNDRVTP